MTVLVKRLVKGHESKKEKRMDFYANAVCQQCRQITACEPVARKNERTQEITIKVLCTPCRADEGKTQTLDDFLSNVKRWLHKLRRSNKPYSEKQCSCGAHLYEVLERVTDLYVPEPQRTTIHELLHLSDLI